LTIQHLRRISREDGLGRLRLATITEARATIRRLLNSLTDARLLLQWLGGGDADAEEPVVPFSELCRQYDLDPNRTAHNILQDLPEWLVKAISKGDL